MSCEEIQQRLHDYLDGELPAESREKLGEHLRSCLICRRELEAIRSLVDRAQKLPTAIEPPRDLWLGIEERLAAVRPVSPATRPASDRERPWWLHLAAAVIALLVLSVPLSVWWVGRQADEPGAPAMAAPGPDQVEADLATMAAQAELARAEDGVLLAKTDLVIAIERHRDLIEDDTLQIFEENMRLLDRAIGELRSALDNDPHNLRLRLLLAARYQQERKLLQKVSRV